VKGRNAAINPLGLDWGKEGGKGERQSSRMRGIRGQRGVFKEGDSYWMECAHY